MIGAALLLSVLLGAKPDAPGCVSTMSVPLFACRNGTATAALPDLPGATYAWSIEGGTIVSGDGTSRVQIALTDAPQARLSCTVVTSECTSSVTGVISVREPLRIGTFTGPSSVEANAPVTLNWTYDGAAPASQLLAGDALPAPVALPASQRSYTFTPQSSGAKTVELLAGYAPASAAPPSGGKRRSAGRTVVSASSCPDARALVHFDVRGCIVGRPRINAPSSIEVGTTFVVSVMLAPGETAHWSATGGTIVSALGEKAGVRADREGTLELSVRVERDASCFAEGSASISVKPRPPACPVAPAAHLELVDKQCGRATVRVTFTGRAPFYGRWSDTGQEFISVTDTLTREVTHGDYGIENFRDSVCSGSVTGNAKFERYLPRVVLETVGGNCTNGKIVAKFTGQPPFTGKWYLGDWFTTNDSQLVIDNPAVGTHQIEVLRDARCPSHDAMSNAVTILQPAPVARMVEGPYCQWAGSPSITVVFDSNMSQPPYTVWWADGAVTTSNSPLHSRFVDNIAVGAIVPYEITRAATGQCEALVPVKRTTVTNRPSPRIDTSRTDTVTCVGKTGKAKLSYVPPGATLHWSLPGAQIVSGQGTGEVTYNMIEAGPSAIRVTATYPDNACESFDFSSVLGLGASSVTDFRAEPATIKVGGTAILKFTQTNLEGFGIPAPPGYGLITLNGCDAGVCTAQFVDTKNVPAQVTIQLQYSNHCDSHYKTATTMVTIVP